MNARSFGILAALALVTLGLVALLLRGKESQELGAGAPVVPGLEARANDVDRVKIAWSNDETVTLIRGEQAWTVVELDGYAADWVALRSLLAGLAQATIAERKTANPAYHDRLGVEDLSTPGAHGARVDLSAGEVQWSLIVGKEAGRQEGQYLRLTDAAQVVLADRLIDLPREPVDWVDDTILDVGPGLIAEVSIQHPDGQVVRISKVSADDANFTLRTLPEGREPQSAFKVNSLANPFSMLRMEDVRSDPGEQESKPIRVRLVLFSGARFEFDIIELDEQRWLRLRQAAPAADESEKTGPGDDPLSNTTADWRDWLYQVSDTRFDVLTTRIEDLLKPREEETGGATQ